MAMTRRRKASEERTLAEVLAEHDRMARDEKGMPLLCTACGEEQFVDPSGSGVNCANGHGGAEGISRDEVKQVETNLRLILESTRVDTESRAVEKTGTASFLAWGGVVSSIYSLDPVRLHKKLVDELALGDGATSYGEVLHAIDKAERNSYDAARLEQAARLELKRREIEVDAEMEVLRTNARAALEQEKKEGLRSRAPTIEEVRDRVVATWQSKVADLERSVAELKGTCAALEQLTRSWNSRCASLRAMMERVAPVGSR